MKERTKALRALTAAITEIAEIIRDLDPGRVAAYGRIADLLEKARGHITQAEAFEP
jgi:alkylated DNA nucleotide flippase Atl1